MSSHPPSRDVKKAIDLLRADAARAWTIDTLALSCGVARRTLEKHFRRFIGQTPMEFLRTQRLGQARRMLLAAQPQADVTKIATQCGFNHLGRFAAWYRERYGESPSATLRRSRYAIVDHVSSCAVVPATSERPVVAVFPFDLIGPGACAAAGISKQIAAALCRLRWLPVGQPPGGRYQLRGTARTDETGRLRVTILLGDAATRRYIWGDCWDGTINDAFEFEDRVSARVARALRSTLRDTEIDRACREDPAQLNAWGLTMRALPDVLSIEPLAEDAALELLERAMELAPQDPLPMSVAAWCHGLRAAHAFTQRPDKERQAARALAECASMHAGSDPLTETMLASAYTLSHDLAKAAVHADRALLLDGGSAWAWGRSAWIHAYGGNATAALERFEIAQTLAPVDPLSFLWSVGIAASHFETARYQEAGRWYRRAFAEQPKAIWINRFLAASYALAGSKELAKRSIVELTGAFPELTIEKVRASLPHCRNTLERYAEGLAAAGLSIG
jgi:AraC-like DNA-binding protein/TolB-like protein/tetratricopeptide (TPR) repeat protein